MEELTIKKIEETPLSQGKTLTELKQQLDKDSNSYLSSKYGTIVGFGLAGALFLGSMVASVLTNGDVMPVLFGMGLSFGPAMFGTSNWKWLATDKSNYEDSFKRYYDAIKETGDINLINDINNESRGMKR